jgi:hypothetical protein
MPAFGRSDEIAIGFGSRRICGIRMMVPSNPLGAFRFDPTRRVASLGLQPSIRIRR